jgi:gamma-glutamyltranspeptidase/glutathione hydrolase
MKLGWTKLSQKPRAATALVAAALLALLLTALPVLGARGGPGSAGVSSESPAATRAAVQVVRKGGNAVDAAVTATLMAGVTSPTSSGIGGGGFALVWDAQAKQATLLDFRETAPSSLDAALFEQRPLAREKIGVLVGTPGELKGLYVLHQRFGKLPWADVVEPARLAATNGFQVGKHLASMLAWGREHLVKDEGLKALFYPGGKPAAFGRVLTNKKLGATLARVAAEGPKAVYEGVIANELVEAARAHGGGLSLADLKGYQPIQRVPLAVDWEGYRVYTMPLPSAGGMMLAQTLGMFSRAELSKLGFESGAYQHLVAEAMRAAVADRMRYLGDPDFQKVDMKALLDPARLAARRKRIALDRTNASPRFG